MSKKIDKRSLELNVYDYFKYCDRFRRIRGVAVITDKQYIFYSQILKNDYGTHNDIEINIENEIHPNSQKYGWDAYYRNHAYIASVGRELIISMPENGELSLAQATFITDILDQTNQYMNEETDNCKKIKIDLFDTQEHESYFDVTDIETLKQKIKGRVTSNITIEEEKIIGTTLSEEEIKKNLLKFLNLEKCSSLKDIINIINKCSMYYCDNYYKDMFCDIFPDYIEIKELMPLVTKINLENEKVENVTLQNIKNIIYTSINNIFKIKNTYQEIEYILFTIVHSEIPKEKKQEMFPNLNLVSKLLIKLYPFNEKQEKSINNLLGQISTYEELASTVCHLAYSKTNNDLIELQHLLLEENNILEKIKIENNIISSKDTLNEMIERKNELDQLIDKYNLKIEKNQMLIEQEEINQDKQKQVIQASSSNFLKKIINKRKIKGITIELNSSELKIQNLKTEREDQLKQIDELEKEIKSIKKKFKDITHLDYFPLDSSNMEFYYQKDNFDAENYLTKTIEELKKKINILKEELLEITNTGFIAIENIEENTPTNDNRLHR